MQKITLSSLTHQNKVIEILPYKVFDPSNSQVVLVLGESSTPDVTESASFKSSVVGSEIPNEHINLASSAEFGLARLESYEQTVRDPSIATTPV